MEPECSEQVSSAVGVLKEQVAALTARRAALAREKSARARRRAADLVYIVFYINWLIGFGLIFDYIIYI